MGALDIDELFKFWERAIQEYEALHETEPGPWSQEVAYVAASRGAYFDHLLNRDELLMDIHVNFEMLESAQSTDAKRMWAQQMRRVKLAKQRYDV
jgi:hypothetical protein